jgi:hypothetical protein
MIKFILDLIEGFESENVENIYLELEKESSKLNRELRVPFETEEDQESLEPILEKMEKVKNKIKKCKEILDQLLDLYAYFYIEKFVKHKIYELYKYTNPLKSNLCINLINKGFSLEHLFSTFSF